jgi:hypothetical protein
MGTTVYDHDATLTEEKALQKIEVGQQAEVTKKPNSYGTLSLFWNPVGSTPPRTAPVNKPSAPLPVKDKSEEDAKWLRIDTSKIVFGYMIAGIEQGLSPNEAKELAVVCHKLQEQAVSEILIGVPPLPQSDVL